MASSGHKRILLAVDGSEQALEAVRYLAAVLPSAETEIVLFHVMTKVPESFWDLEKEPAFHYRIANVGAWERQQEKMIGEFMEGARALLLDAGFSQESVSARVQERKAGIARDIMAESGSGYDGVVVGRKGLSDLKDLVMGSIADKLVGKLAHVPLWIVGGKEHTGKLLLSLDASEGARQAVEYVAKVFAGSPGPEITLFHALRSVDVFMQGFGESFAVSYGMEWLQKAQEELDEAAKEIEAAYENARDILVKAGLDSARIRQKTVKGISSRAGAIVDEAQAGDYSTIVVGRRGLSKIEEFFIGRVSSKVVQMAKDKTVWVVS